VADGLRDLKIDYVAVSGLVPYAKNAKATLDGKTFEQVGAARLG
jgi:hypothetical protein